MCFHIRSNSFWRQPLYRSWSSAEQSRVTRRSFWELLCYRWCAGNELNKQSFCHYDASAWMNLLLYFVFFLATIFFCTWEGNFGSSLEVNQSFYLVFSIVVGKFNSLDLLHQLYEFLHESLAFTWASQSKWSIIENFWSSNLGVRILSYYFLMCFVSW